MEKYKKIFEKHKDQSSFIKVTSPARPVDGQQKAALNRKGNQMFNEGDIEGARRIFLTTGYSDGLSRVGDNYKSNDKLLEALQMYWAAPDKRKSEPLIERLAGVIQNLLKNDDESVLPDNGINYE